MKTRTHPPTLPDELREDDISAYAYHLYEQSGRVSGRDEENWFEARACLTTNIPMHQSHRRLHEHLTGQARVAALPHHAAA